MTNLFSVFEAIDNVSGKLDKKALLATINDKQKQMFCWALDPGVVFFQTVDEQEVIKEAKRNLTFGDNEVYNAFSKIAEKLTTRELTGTAATEEVRMFFSCCNAQEAKWFARVLNKDLQIGVDSAFLDVHPGAFEVFEPQLCNTYEGDRDVEGWYFEDKWNGLRALAVPNKANVHGWYSRNGKPIPGMDHLTEELVNAKYPGDGKFVLDGEGFGGDWERQVAASVSAIRGNQNHEKITFNVFDFIPLDQWNRISEKKYKTIPLRERKVLLNQFFEMNPQLKKIRKVPYGVIGGQFTPEAVRDEAISRKLEGVVMKDPDGHYKPGKGNLWLKYKKRYPADCEIIDAEAMPKHPEQLGAIVVKNPDTGIISKVGTGSGFTKNNRIELLKLHKKGQLVGRTAEIEYGEITEDGCYFHSAFLKLRFDK